MSIHGRGLVFCYLKNCLELQKKWTLRPKRAPPSLVTFFSLHSVFSCHSSLISRVATCTRIYMFMHIQIQVHTKRSLSLSLSLSLLSLSCFSLCLYLLSSSFFLSFFLSFSLSLSISLSLDIA